MGQDARFADKQRASLRAMSFPALYSRRVDMTRVKLPALTAWIHATVEALLGFPDDVVASLVVNTLQQHADGKQALDPRELQLTLTGFLEQSAPVFVEALYRLLLDACAAQSGIPQQLVEQQLRDMQRQQQQQQRQQPPASGAGSSSALVVPPPATSALPPSSETASVPPTVRRGVRAKSRFGPPLTAAQKANAVRSEGSNANPSRQHSSKQPVDETLPAATDTQPVKRQRTAHSQ